MSTGHQHSRLESVISALIGCAFIAASLFIVFDRQYIIDQIAVWQFKPSAEINALADRSGVNNRGRFLYFASQPEIQESKDFNSSCSRVEAVTSILGCYNNGRIYIYNVMDPQLDGVREVTAAHEMLHAVYVRLAATDKAQVDNLLEAEYKKLALDQTFQQKMAFYERAEPGQRDNELHSVIGTEVSAISPELEAYYSKYFSDRQAVVSLNSKYITVFRTLEAQANGLKAQMDSIASDISKRSDQYNIDVTQLDRDIQSFNYQADSALFDSQYQFNQRRSNLVGRVSALNNDKLYINGQVAAYNALVADYNSLATQSQSLYNSMDSTLAPSPSI